SPSSSPSSPPRAPPPPTAPSTLPYTTLFRSSAAGGARGDSRAVVDDLQVVRVCAVADVDPGVRLTRVLERVRERLLHDPVGRQLDPDRERAPLAVDVELDRKPRLAHLRDEPRQLGE